MQYRFKAVQQLFIIIVCYLLLFMLPTHTRAQLADTSTAKKTLLQRSSVAPIPILSYNRSYGVTAGLMLNAFTKFDSRDTVSPASRTTFGLGYTQNKSWVLLASQMLFLRQDRWRINWSLGLGNVNFQYLDEAGEAGNAVFVKYQTNASFFSTTVLYKIRGRFYTGVKYQYSKSSTLFNNSNIPSDTTILSSWGMPITFDNRDYVYYPQKGINANIQFNNYPKWLGSDVTFSAVTAHINHFRKLTERGVLASRFYTYTGLGTVPFVGQKAIGGKDLRGYTKGQYRNNTLMALQTEYRLSLQKKWGMVAFGGVAAAWGAASSKYSGLLPAAGTGLRYAIMPRQKLNIGAEIAVGKNDWGFYFRIGETF